MTEKKSKVSLLKFSLLNENKAKKELRKYFEDFVAVKLNPKLTYSIKFLERDLLFVVNKQFSSSLVTQITAKKGILGIIMEYNNASNGYFSDKLVLCKPKSKKEIHFEITDMKGDPRYTGTGKIRKNTIEFLIKGTSSEGKIRSRISGTISQKTIKFKKSTMPNKFFKKTIKNPKVLELHN